MISAVTDLCEAVKPPDVAEKLVRLRALQSRADSRWRSAVETGIRDLEVYQAAESRRAVPRREPPADDPRHIRLRSVTPTTAPERVVYEVFAHRVVTFDRRSNDPALAPEHREQIRRRLQLATGLNDEDYAVFKSIAYRLVADLEANGREGAAVMRD